MEETGEKYERPHPPDYMFPYFAGGLFIFFMFVFGAIIKSHWVKIPKLVGTPGKTDKQKAMQNVPTSRLSFFETSALGTSTNQLTNNRNLHLTAVVPTQESSDIETLL